MNSYLHIAQKIIQFYRHPMTAKSILSEAYKSNLLPDFLYGKTQQKTLQARLSEDILKNKEKSLFFRVKPGVFFLREFISDKTINEQDKQEYHAKRRCRDLYLHQFPIVCLEKNKISKWSLTKQNITYYNLKKIIENNELIHLNYRIAKTIKDVFLIKCFSCLWYKNKLLTYKPIGKRNHNYDFIKKRSYGFSSYLSLKNLNLFNLNTYGINELSKNIIKNDLNLDNNFDNIIISNNFKYGIINNLNKEIIIINYIKINQELDLRKKFLSINSFKWVDPSYQKNSTDESFDEDSILFLNSFKFR